MGKAEAAFIPPPDFGLGVAEELASLEHALDFGALQAEDKTSDQVQMAKDQSSLPRNPYYSTEEINAYARGQAEMLLAGFRKVKKTKSEQRELALRTALEITEEWLLQLCDYAYTAYDPTSATRDELLRIIGAALREGKDK